MHFHEREFFIDRILSGKIRLQDDNDTYIFKWPNKKVRYEASEIYFNIINDKQLNLLTEEEILPFLLEIEYITEHDIKQLETGLNADIEKFKVYMYENYQDAGLLEHYRGYLKIANLEYNRLYSKRHIYNYATLEGYALFCKQIYILEKCTTPTPVNIIKFLDLFNRNILSEEVIRELARSEPWRNIWSSHSKTGLLFKKFLNDEQRRLVSWSMMYDNLYEHAELPEEVINDDDVLDGFLIKRKQDKDIDKAQKHVENNLINDKNSGAQEIFIPVKSDKDIERINNLNSPLSKHIKKSRINAVLQAGELQDSQLPDVKMELKLKRTQMESERINGR